MKIYKLTIGVTLFALASLMILSASWAQGFKINGFDNGLDRDLKKDEITLQAGEPADPCQGSSLKFAGYTVHSEADLRKALNQSAEITVYICKDLNITQPFSISQYSGHLDGQGHMLNFSRTQFENRTGLFGEMTEDAIVENLVISEVTMIIDDNGDHINHGILAKANRGGTIRNVTITDSHIFDSSFVTQSRKEKVGLLVGFQHRAHIEHVQVINSFLLTTEHSSKIGSLIGQTSNSVIRHVDIIDTSVEGGDMVGGLIGRSTQDTIQHVHFHANREGRIKAKTNIGGIVGSLHASRLSNARISGSVQIKFTRTGDQFSMGGIVGFSNDGSRISRAGVTRDVSINPQEAGDELQGERVGGIIGFANGVTLREVYNLSKVSGALSIGGIAGRADRCNINTSYSNTEVQSGNVAGGGIVGDAAINGAFLSHVFSAGRTRVESTMTTHRGLFGSGSTRSRNAQGSFFNADLNPEAPQFEFDNEWDRTQVQLSNPQTYFEERYQMVLIANENAINTSFPWNMIPTSDLPFLSWDSFENQQP